MADSTESEGTPQDGAEETPAQETHAESFDADYVKKLRAESAKYRTEAKANADAAKRLAEIEDANKSEQEKLQERLAAAEQREADANARLLRAEVASEKGLTAKQAARLTGTTKEELAADADEFLADLADKYVPKTASPSDTGAGLKGDGSTNSTKDNSPDAIAQRLKSQGLF